MLGRAGVRCGGYEALTGGFKGTEVINTAAPISVPVGEE